MIRTRLRTDYGTSKSDLYDGEVSYVDAQVGELWKQLENRKLMDNTLLILTADHGEALGEHDLIGHKWKVYEETLHVPLILVGPGIPHGHRIRALAHHIDIAPTLLDYVGLSRPDFYEGKSLLPMIEGGGKIHDYVLMEKATPPFRAWKHDASWKKYPYSQWAVRTEQEKFIWSSDGRHEYYDLGADPNEEHNLFDAKRQRAIQLFEAGYQERLGMPKFRLASHPGRKKGDRDAEQTLRALGYLN
jgi:arylsulfatase A-like enzyme